MLRLIPNLLLLLLATYTYGQTSAACSIQTVREVEKNLESLSAKDISNFFLTFNRSCDNNVEYSQYSNEILFKVLDRYPQGVIVVLQTNQDRFQIDEIFDAMASPINDVNVESLMSKIDGVSVKGKVKTGILAQLKKAQARI